MCCKRDIEDRLWFRFAVDVLYWHVHRHDKKEEGEDVRPPPAPPERTDMDGA
jgi:hypothetical protein